ncbi:MAG: class I SAM-dependent DNA methyltransferase [Candidatus Woesearchaeota archaeon]
MASNWISYNELAWTEDFLADSKKYKDEVNKYVGLINDTAEKPINTVLHLGCGSGGHDFHFKKYYKITGVDLSTGMLEKAKKTNPEIEYLEGDMRTIRLNRQFDCVIIPDSIDYMVSLDDLKQAIQTSAVHLKPGGVLMIVGKTKETFHNNNFAYTGEKGKTQVTVIENNYVNPFVPNTYEITLLYLIRKNGKLSKYIEESKAGLFPEKIWDNVLKNAGFKMKIRSLDGIYDDYLLEKGEYPLTIFIGKKGMI